MTGNTLTVLLGLAVVALTLPIGLLLLYLGDRGIERAHPSSVERTPRSTASEESATVPGPRAASTREALTAPEHGARAAGARTGETKTPA
jgi:hypothetical protein